MFREIRDMIRRRFAPRREQWAMPTALFVVLATALVALTAVFPLRTGLQRESFARGYAADLLGSLDQGALLLVGDVGGSLDGVEARLLRTLQAERGLRTDVTVKEVDLTAGDDAVAAATAFAIADAAGPVYLTYGIDHLRPEWRTVAIGRAYRLVPPDEEATAALAGAAMTFPDDLPAAEQAFRAFVALAEYRYAAYLQETAGKEAALPFLLHAIEYDEVESSVTYTAYTARRQVLIDRGGKR
jgi:hypothetical protein